MLYLQSNLKWSTMGKDGGIFKHPLSEFCYLIWESVLLAYSAKQTLFFIFFGDFSA